MAKRNDDQIPGHLAGVFSQLNLDTAKPDISATIASLKHERIVLQDFVPLYKSLEWELAGGAWENLGVQPFADGSVPFYITSSGRLSHSAALLLFLNCHKFPQNQRIKVLELAAGSGLFARLFLDSFRDLCQQEGKDYYDRLTYFVTDLSAKTVVDWSRLRLFESHEAQVDARTLDIMAENAFADSEVQALQAVYCNYCLDVLPYSVIQYRRDGLQELFVRSSLSKDEKLLERFTELSIGDVEKLSDSADPEERRKLMSISPILEREMAYQVMADEELVPDSVKHWLQENNIQALMAVNHGAIRCLQKCARILHENGHILINDYGPVSNEEVAEKISSKRYGLTLAMDINFPLLEFAMSTAGFTCVKSDDDAEKTLHSRLILKSEQQDQINAFGKCFGSEVNRYIDEPLKAARELANNGRVQDAKFKYQQALERLSNDWFIIAEVAEFLRHKMSDAESALPLAKCAVAMNPWYSTWLWDILGDCLFGLGRYDDAHQAYQQALCINPNDSSSNFRIACTHEMFGEYELALQAIATGLASDKDRSQRESLLDRQRQILAKI